MKKTKILAMLFCVLFIISLVPAYINGAPRQSEEETVDTAEETMDLASSFSTALQAPITQELLALEGNTDSDIPIVETINFENGTILTIIDYCNGTKYHITKTFFFNRTLTLVGYNDEPLSLNVPTVQGEATESITETYDKLMGFTVELLDFYWAFRIRGWFFGYQYDIVNVGFSIYCGFGIRLPVEIDLTYPEEMAAGCDYLVNVTLNTVNWSEADFATALPAIRANENEFLSKFEARLWCIFEPLPYVRLINIDYGFDFDFSSSFTTPLGPGPGGAFALPDLTAYNLIELLDYYLKIHYGLDTHFADYIGLNIFLRPLIGSDKITAGWTVTGDATGEGLLTWSEPSKQSFGIHINETAEEGEVEIALYDFRYYITQFFVDIGLRLEFKDFLEPINDFLDWAHVPREFTLLTIDLSFIFDLLPGELYLGEHPGSALQETSIQSEVVRFGIELAATPTQVDVVPGNTETYDIEVNNTGNVEDTFSLGVEGLPDNCDYELSASEVTLESLATTVVTLSVTPCRDWSTTPGYYPFNITATSQGAEAWELVTLDKENVVVHVLPFYDVDVLLSPVTDVVYPGGTGVYTFEVMNLGNVPDSFDISLFFMDFDGVYQVVPTSIQPEWVTVDKPFMTLDPGTSDVATISIIVPCDWAGMEDADYEFIVNATSVTDPTVSDSSFDLLTVQSTVASKFRYINWQIDELKSYINDNLCWHPSWILDHKLSLAQMHLQWAFWFIEWGCVTRGLVHENGAKVLIECTEFKVELFNRFCKISDENAEYIINSLHSIRNNIVLLKGASVGTEQGFDIALIEVDLLNLNDFIDEEINCWYGWRLEHYIWSATVFLERAIYKISLDRDPSWTLLHAQHKLECAKYQIIRLLNCDKISQELADELLLKIGQAQEDIEDVKNVTNAGCTQSIGLVSSKETSVVNSDKPIVTLILSFILFSFCLCSRKFFNSK